MKKRVVYLTGISGAIISSVNAMASETVGTANDAVVSALTSVSNDMLATANSVIPVALTVIGVSLVVVFGIRIFKRIAGR